MEGALQISDYEKPRLGRAMNKKQFSYYKWHVKNREKKKEYYKKWKEENKEIYQRCASDYRKNNKEECYRRTAEWYKKNRWASRLGKMEYLARKINAVPSWSEKKAIRDFYRNTPPGMVVDHIVPLRGRAVRGLHVLANLQYLTQKENSIKNNKFPYEVH